MGIPSLFRVLVQEDESLFHKHVPKCDFFYLDYNCLIHHASRGVSNSDEDVITQVVSYTRTLINDIVKPSDCVFIAMDGPVPVAKMIRQRERRFKKIEPSDTNSTFDSNKITPGTEFMHKLAQRIHSLISLRVFQVRCVLFSDSSVPGEGEWKIFQHIRNECNSATLICLYGLDADLVVWTMASNCLRNVILCREDDDGVLMFFELYQSLNRLLHKKHGLNIHDYKVLWDIVLVLMLGGNDFVSPIECLKIRNQGWTHLIECYVRFGQSFVDHNKRVNWDMYHQFLTFVSSFEDTLSKKMYTKQLRACNQPMTSNEDIENVPFASLQHPLYSLYGTQSISIPYYDTQRVWKKHYYERIFGHPFTIPGFMNTICRDYLASIVWCWEYYTNHQLPSWVFAYEHIAAPCLSDVVFWYTRVFHESVSLAFTPGTCLRPIEQLVCVVPLPRCNYLLPQVLRLCVCEIPENPTTAFQVDDFLIEPITGQKMIYAPPLLPRIDIHKVRHFVCCLEEYFDEKEHHLNTLRESY